jgi:hypothetical protein
MRVHQRVPEQKVQRKCDCSSGGDCGCGGKKKVQRKARVSQPFDPEEREADRMAEQALSGSPVPAEPGETPALRSRGEGGGTPLPQRDFFEQRLGHDFSAVRVHDDSRAHSLAAGYGARAFTFGPDIYFGSGQLDPYGPSGRHLIAHELTHTVQQDGDTTVRRLVSTGTPHIRELLSYGITDWAIRDAEAHEAIAALSGMTPIDLADTVGALDDDDNKYLDRLFDNITEDDQRKFRSVLQDIQKSRHWKVKDKEGHESSRVDSCPPKDRGKLDAAQATGLHWIDTAVAKLKALIANPKTKTAVEAAAALKTHFKASDADTAGKLVIRLEALGADIRSGRASVECAAPTDPMCADFAAYATSGPIMRYCQRFLDMDAESRAGTLVHESAHLFAENLGEVRHATDRAYTHERLYRFLTTAEAFDNADSYEAIIDQLGRGEEVPITAPEDSVSDCGQNADAVRLAVARAQRVNTQTLNHLASATQAGFAPTIARLFPEKNRPNLESVVDTYRGLSARLSSSVSIECEDSCAPSATGYYRKPGWAAHVCPSFFSLAPDAQVPEMYQLLMAFSASLSNEEAKPYTALALEQNQKGPAPTGPPPPPPPKLYVHDSRPKTDDPAAYGALVKFFVDVQPKIQEWVTKTTADTKARPDFVQLRKMVTVMDELVADLKARTLRINFNAPVEATKGAYQMTEDELRLRKPAAGLSQAAIAANVIHEYVHVQQDRDISDETSASTTPVQETSEDRLRREVSAFMPEAYFVEALQALGHADAAGPAGEVDVYKLFRGFNTSILTAKTAKERERQLETRNMYVAGSYKPELDKQSPSLTYRIEIESNGKATLFGPAKIELGMIPLKTMPRTALRDLLLARLQSNAADEIARARTAGTKLLYFRAYFEGNELVELAFAP